MRRPWWDRPAWTRHIASTPGTPAAPTGVPWIERGGLSAGEQARWNETTAWLGVEMDARFAAIHARYHAPAPRRVSPGWAYTAICCAGGCLLIALVLMFGGHT